MDFFICRMTKANIVAYTTCASKWQDTTVNLRTKQKVNMETTARTKKRTLLSSMEDVITKAKEFSITPELYEAAAESLEHLSIVLQLTKDEAMLLSFFFEMCSSSRIWMSNIAEMVNTSNLRIISMMNVADSLISKGYIRRGSKVRDENWYSVPGNVLDCIRQDIKPSPRCIKGLTFDGFFDVLGEYMNEEETCMGELEEHIDMLIQGNPHLNYCKVAESYGLRGRDKVMLHIFAHRLINEDDDMIGTHDWEDYVESKRIIKNMVRSWKSGESDLIKKNIFEAYPSDNMRDADFYHLTDQAKEELFPDMNLVETTAKEDKSLISHNSFAAKELFYPEKVQAKIARLTELLQPDKFDHVTERLSENGMRKGFACLFYGSPGTGKTETVNQLARLTGRDVMVVDVTQIKSCWVGESEQNIKKLFDKYKALVKKSAIAPILLFNEADAVLGIRQEGAQRAVDKMENSIQNIILQEMETLEGIMIATTNLTSNLDKAFERRFIYKIEFERPTAEAKKQIWKSLIPSLTDEFAQSLAQEFDLSGGQIENIARKRTVELILSGEEPSEEMMREYCREETLSTRNDSRSRIGFTSKVG